MFHYQFKLTGEVPAKKNANKFNRKTKVMYKNKHFQDWHAGALAELMQQERPAEPITAPVIIHIYFIHGDQRKRDSDNGTTSIFDLLQDAGILSNDNWQLIPTYLINNDYRKDEPRCYIYIDELDQDETPEQRAYYDE